MWPHLKLDLHLLASICTIMEATIMKQKMHQIYLMELTRLTLSSSQKYVHVIFGDEFHMCCEYYVYSALTRSNL